MVQTPQQRAANAKYYKSETYKRGKPESALPQKSKGLKSPISPVWIGVLAFLLCGGLLFELLKFFF